jgi:hypothetical protein
MMYHILIDGGAALNLISLAAFKKLQILMSKLQLPLPFSGVGPVPVIPCRCISLLLTFGTSENFCTESALFDIVEVSLPFNAILGRPALYQFMAVVHYGYLILKMSPPKWRPQDPRRPQCRCLYAREAPGSGCVA